MLGIFNLSQKKMTFSRKLGTHKLGTLFELLMIPTMFILSKKDGTPLGRLEAVTICNISYLFGPESLSVIAEKSGNSQRISKA